MLNVFLYTLFSPAGNIYFIFHIDSGEMSKREPAEELTE